MICRECNGKGGFWGSGTVQGLDGASIIASERFTPAGRAALKNNGRPVSRRMWQDCETCSGEGEVMDVLTVKETAKKLKISVRTLQEMTKQGELTAFRLKRRLVYREHDLDRYLEGLEIYAPQ